MFRNASWSKIRSKSIVIYSDVHDGSTTAICSPDPETTEKNTTYKPNKLQKALYQIWEECIDDLTQKPSAKVINGEPFDGGNKKQLGNQSWSTSMNDQINDFVKLWNKVPGDQTILVRGSDYHVNSEGTSYEEILADKLKVKPYKAFGGSGLTDYYALVKLNGKVFNFTHHIGFNRWFAYRTTALAREMAAMHFEKDKIGSFDVIVRSHVHYWVNVNFVHTKGFTTPAWKYPDGHLFRGGMGGTTPDIGCVEVIIEPNGKIIIEPHIVALEIKPQVLEIA